MVLLLCQLKKSPEVSWQQINSYKVRHSHKLRKNKQEYWLDIKSIDFINSTQWEPTSHLREFHCSSKLFFVWMEHRSGPVVTGDIDTIWYFYLYFLHPARNISLDYQDIAIVPWSVGPAGWEKQNIYKYYQNLLSVHFLCLHGTRY